MERLFLFTFPFVADSGHKLGHNDQVNDDTGSQQGILANVVTGENMLTAHEDFADVFVDCFLAVTTGRDVLDHDCVVWVLCWDFTLGFEKFRVFQNVRNALGF